MSEMKGHCGLPADGTIWSVDEVDLRLSEDAHPFHLEHADEGLAFFETAKVDYPGIFNGLVSLESAMSFENGRLSGTSHLIPFSSFLLWRSKYPVDQVFHVFAIGLIRTSDGKLIAGRMADHTANPGQIYCPSGSLDADDVRDGKFDLEANIAREIREEVGVDLRSAAWAGGWHVLFNRSFSIVLRQYHFDITSHDLIAAVQAHIASEPEPEIVEVLALDGKNVPEGTYAKHMKYVLDWVFAD